MKKTKRLILPVILLWRDRTIDLDGASILSVPWAFVRKGRTLTIRDIDEEHFEFRSFFTMDIRGSIRVARKPKEISVDDLRNTKN